MILSGNKITTLIDKKEYPILKRYISLGYDLSLTDVNGDFLSKFGSSENPAFEAILSKDLTVLKKTNSKIWDSKNQSGYSCLHWAIILHNYNATRFLIDSGVRISDETNTKENAMTLAARFNNADAFFYLLKKKHKESNTLIKTQNERGFNSLHFACANKNRKMIAHIIESESKSFISQKNTYGATPLHWLAHGRKLSDKSKLVLLRDFCQKTRATHNIQTIHNMVKANNVLEISPLNWLEIYDNQASQQFLSGVIKNGR